VSLQQQQKRSSTKMCAGIYFFQSQKCLIGASSAVSLQQKRTSTKKFTGIFFFQLQIYLLDASSSVSLQHKFEKKSSITEPATESTKKKIQMILQELAVDVGAITKEISEQFQ
jgi:hypothetical protein